jgi:hypothetical protein
VESTTCEHVVPPELEPLVPEDEAVVPELVVVEVVPEALPELVAVAVPELAVDVPPLEPVAVAVPELAVDVPPELVPVAVPDPVPVSVRAGAWQRFVPVSQTLGALHVWFGKQPHPSAPVQPPPLEGPQAEARMPIGAARSAEARRNEKAKDLMVTLPDCLSVRPRVIR